MFFGLCTRLAAYDNHRDLLRVAEGGKRLKQFVAGIFRHAQIKQDSVGLGFEGQRQALLRLAGINDFIAIA